MGIFKKSEKASGKDYYTLLDSNSRFRARGLRKEAPDGKTLFLSLTDGDPALLSHIGIFQAVPQDKDQPSLMVRFIGSRERIVALELMRDSGSAMRKNFRVPVRFESFVYPQSGGRAALHSIDLSCGGIAFRSPLAISVGEHFELVIPLTSEGPLLLWAEALRIHLDPDGNLYACKFIDLIDDQETLLREAVFAIQVGARAKGA
ncbi:MAG: PilZ domain-containing protein [Ruminococcaceae bacterium]|jgi:hypothetical protein|nr:PilZ domain-containing protein [Oscillospiraceae bacterium]